MSRAIRDWRAANGVLVPLGRPSGQEVNVAAEDIFELIFEPVEVPAEVHAGRERDEGVNVSAGVRLATSEGAEDLKPCDGVLFAEPGEIGLHFVQRRRVSQLRYRGLSRSDSANRLMFHSTISGT